MDKDPTVLNNPATGWSNEETVSKGIRLSDDHIHIALTDNNDLLVATKSSDGNDNINLFVRWNKECDGISSTVDCSWWSGPFFITSNATRPIVLFDKDNDYVYVYVFYTNLSGTDKIAYKKIPLSWLDPVFFTPTGSLGSESAFLSCCTDPDPDVNVGLNDVTSTKQQVDNTMEILVVASGSYPSADRRAYYKVLSLP